MAGKRGLVMGVANDRSHRLGHRRGAAPPQGAELAFTYQGEALEKRVKPLAEQRRLEPRRCPATSPTRRASTPPSPTSPSAGTGSISSSMPSPSPTRRSSRAATSTPPRANFAHDDGHLLLLLHRRLPARRADDDRRRQPADPHLSTAPSGSCRTTTSWASPRRRSRPACAISPPISAAAHPGQRDLRRADQDAGRLGHRRFPLHPAVERAELAAEAQRHHRGGRRRRRSTCCAICRAASPARSTTSTAAITSSACCDRCGAEIAESCCRARPEELSACRPTASASSSASPPGARATGRRSAASSTAARRACRWPSRHPALARPPPARPVALHHPAPRARPGQHPLRRVRGPDHRHADRLCDRERGPALQGLRRDQGHASAPATPTTPTGRNTASATIAAAAAPRRARPPAASPPAPSPAWCCGCRRSRDPRRAGPDRAASRSTARRWDWDAVERQPVLLPRRRARRPTGRPISTGCARPAPRPAPSSRWWPRACRPGSARRSTASSTPTWPRR